MQLCKVLKTIGQIEMNIECLCDIK